jgi:hypothetical protein
MVYEGLVGEVERFRLVDIALVYIPIEVFKQHAHSSSILL